MIFTDVKIKGIRKEFGELERIMGKLGFVRWSWDYGKATYDLKYTLDGIDYYLRLTGRVVNEKRLENRKALLELEQPQFVRHFFPHGLDENAEVPQGLQEEVQAKLAELEKTLSE